MKIKCVIDKVRFTKKPTEAGSIVKRMTLGSANEYSLEEIKMSILQGKTIRPSHCGEKKIEWKSQQMFMIDIDNEANLTDDIVLGDCIKLVKGKKNKVRFLVGSKQHHTYEQILEHCRNIGLIPSLIYTSFNHRSDQHKMRLVFTLDEVIADSVIAEKVQLYLMNMVGGVDEQCKNLNRIYYGGKEIVFDNGSILNAKELMELSKDINYDSSEPLQSVKSGERGTIILNEYKYLPNIIVPQNPEPLQIKGYNIQAISNRDTLFLKNRINNPPLYFDNQSEFWFHVYHDLNMAELLEFKYPSSVKCIFHQDNNPSASVFQNKDGVWIYKCHSASCGLTINIKQLIEKLGGFKSEYKAIEFIKNIYNLNIKESDWSIEQRANLDSILYNLDMNVFAELCPQASKNIRYIKDLFVTMLHIAKSNIYGENYMNSDGDVVFFVSLAELAKIMKVYSTNHNKISQRLAVLIYHQLIKKLDDNMIPKMMLKKSQALCIEKGYGKRVNFYSIPSWVFEQLKIIEEQGLKWKENGYTVKGTSYEMFYRAEGLEVAQKIYPQHKKISVEMVDTETGEIFNTIQDKRTTIKSDQKVKRIVDLIEELIIEKGYTTEKELISRLSSKYRWDVIEVQLKKMRGEFLKWGFKRIRANKEIKEKFNVGTEGYPFLIIKK